METTDPTTAEQAHITVRRLVRRREKRLVAGVAGGLADYSGLDPAIFRILFVVLSFAGGAGAFLYLLGWGLVPEAGERFSKGERFVRRFRRTSWLGVAFLVAAALFLFSETGLWTPTFLWAVALIVIGIVLLRDDIADETARSKEISELEPDVVTDSFETEVLRVRRERRPRSPLGLLTVAAALLVVGIGSVLSNTGVITLELADHFALGVATIGCGLLVGTLWGRARLTIVLGVLLVPFLLAASLVEMPLEGDLGVLVYNPRSVDAVEAGYKMAVGEMTLDLSDVPFDEGQTRIPITLAVGELDIYVPRDVRVSLDGTVDLGGMQTFGRLVDGENLVIDRSFGDVGADKEVVLDIEAGIGSVDARWTGARERSRR